MVMQLGRLCRIIAFVISVNLVLMVLVIRRDIRLPLIAEERSNRYQPSLRPFKTKHIYHEINNLFGSTGLDYSLYKNNSGRVNPRYGATNGSGWTPKAPSDQIRKQIEVDRAVAFGVSGRTKVNAHDYALMINEPDKCVNEDGSLKSVFLLVLIATAPAHVGQRKAVRETWASRTEVDGERVVIVFLFGKTGDPRLQRIVAKESETFHDVLLEDFVDSYRNLTLKTIMGMKWASEFCPHAKYVMKTDDDMYVGVENLVRYLNSPGTPSTLFVTGRTIHEAPIRRPKSKWYVSTSVFPGTSFPPFCSGTGYVLSGDVARMVNEISIFTPFIHLEDVFVGICLDQLNITPVRHIHFNNGFVAYHYCRYRTIFTSHMSKEPTAMRYYIWEDSNNHKDVHCNIPFWPGNDPIF